MRFFSSLLTFCLLSLTCFAAPKPYLTPKPFMNLFYDVTGASDPSYPKNKTNASQTLINSESQATDPAALLNGPLLLFINSSLYIYDNQGKLLLNQTMRTAPNSGFYEMTSLSHIGLGLAYLVQAKKNGDTHWRAQLEAMLKDIKAIQMLNKNKKENWLDAVDVPAWRPYKKQIKNMVSYACAMSIKFIDDVLANRIEFNQTNLSSHFFEGNGQFKIPYNNVMIGTFMLTAVMSLDDIHKQVSKLSLDWPKAKVLIRFVAGQNVTAGVTPQSNWLVPLVKALSKNALPDNHIFIAPYTAVNPALGQKVLPKTALDYYNGVFAHVYNRITAAKTHFDFLPDFPEPVALSMPGDYDMTKADNIEDFLARLKYSLSSPTEMLSNTVVFWMAGEMAAKNWDVNQINIPGLTTGFPKGINGYPS